MNTEFVSFSWTSQQDVPTALYSLVLGFLMLKETMRCLRSHLSFFGAHDFVVPKENHDFHC